MNSTLAGITIESGVNVAGEAFCTVIARNVDNQMFVGQLSPDQIRNEVLGWLSAAEAAEQDAAVLRVMRNIVGDDQANQFAAAVIAELRTTRKDLP